jgi:hypothetical protein
LVKKNDQLDRYVVLVAVRTPSYMPAPQTCLHTFEQSLTQRLSFLPSFFVSSRQWSFADSHAEMQEAHGLVEE